VDNVSPTALIVLRVTVGTGVWIPVPVRVIECGLPDILSAIVRVPIADPVPVGVNVSGTMHGTPTFNVGQVLAVVEKAPDETAIDETL
jgi:hypothetical protein